MAEILKDVFEDEKGNQHYLANNTETTFDQNGTPLNNGGDLSEASVNFTVSSSRKALTAKARFKALMGDIAKWLTDLGPAAFYKVADDFTTTAENYLFTARKGKQLKDEVDNLNQNLESLKGGQEVVKKLLEKKYITNTENNQVYKFTVNVNQVSGYDKFTANNFGVEPCGYGTGSTSAQTTNQTAYIDSYNPSTGVLTVALLHGWINNSSWTSVYNIYLYQFDVVV